MNGVEKQVRRALALVLTLALSGSVGACKKKDEGSANPEAQMKGKGRGKGKGKGKGRSAQQNAAGTFGKMDPAAMKEFRADICYFGTLSLRQARASYLASLGGEEPSASKVPSFDVSPLPILMPAARGQGKGAAAQASADARTAELRPGDVGRAPFSRHSQACTAAAHLTEPAMGDVDAALADYAPLVSAMAEDITATNTYLLRGAYKDDGFEKGKELHEKLTVMFGRFDESAAKVGQALAAWHKAHPASKEGLDEPQKQALSLVEDARDLIPPIVGTPDAEGFKAAVAKLDADTTAFKALSASQTTPDPWTTAMVTPLDALLKDAKEAEAALGEEELAPEIFSRIATEVVFVIEQKQRAAARQRGIANPNRFGKGKGKGRRKP